MPAADLMPQPERLQALRMAAARLAARHPKNVTEFEHCKRQLLAHVAWRGVVVVVDKATGEQIVRSLPGQPAMPDPASVAHS
jgi:hypothetical protein